MSVLNMLASLLSLVSLIALIVFGIQAIRKRAGAGRKAGLAFGLVVASAMLFNVTQSPEQRADSTLPQTAGERVSAAPTPSTQQAKPAKGSSSQGSEPSARTTPKIQLKAVATGPYTVSVEVQTNLPDTAVLSASLGLANQNPDDVFIGTAFREMAIHDVRARLEIDGEKWVQPADATLPAGTYDVEVAFHPLWEQNREIAQTLGIADSVQAGEQVTLTASGGSAEAEQKRQQDQKWIMQNVDMGTPWDEAKYVGRFGSYRELPLEDGNPRVLKMLYFPSIDMTQELHPA